MVIPGWTLIKQVDYLMLEAHMKKGLSTEEIMANALEIVDETGWN